MSGTNDDGFSEQGLPSLDVAEPNYRTPRCLPFHLALSRLGERFADVTAPEIAMWCMPGVFLPKQWVAPPAEKGELPAYIEYNPRPGKKPRWIRFRLDEQWRRHDPGQSKWDVTAVLATASFRAEDVDRFIPERRWLTYSQVQERWRKQLSSEEVRALLEAKARAGILTASHPVNGFVQPSAHHHRLVDESDSTSFPPIEYAMFVLAEIEDQEAGWPAIRFPREQVLRLWPEVSESCLRDGAPAPAEGNANVKPGESSLLTFRAPADRPDPFGQHWWDLMQVLAWVYLGNRAVVRAAAPQDPFESPLTRKDLRDLGRHGACYPHFADAEDAAIEALQAGRLTAFGVANGEGERNEIPSLLWVDLVFRYGPNIAGPKDLLRIGVTCWHDLRFQRKAVLEVWPDPLELVAMADEQKTSTTAEQNETPEKRRAKILARHQELKAARDPHPTKTLAKAEGVSESWIRQMIRKARKESLRPAVQSRPRPVSKAR